MTEAAQQTSSAQAATKPAVANEALVSWEPKTATEAWQLSKYYHPSGLLPKDLKVISDVFVVISAGRDFGWSPMQSFRGIYVVKGKPSLSADAMVGLAKSRPDICEYFTLIESTPTLATFETKRKSDKNPVRMTFSIQEARDAGLFEKDSTWSKYPARMLRNRCKSALCKEVYEELFFGTYEESEAREVEREVKSEAKPRARATVDETPKTEGAAPTASAASQATIDAEIVDPLPDVAPPPTTSTETPHDPKTGETGDSPAPSIADKLVEKIQGAKSIDELSEIAKLIKGEKERGTISNGEREELVTIYEKRRKEVLTPGAKP